MVLDIGLLLTEDGKKQVSQSQERRFKDTAILKECEEAYIAWKKARGDLDTYNMNKNSLQKKIAERKKKDKKDTCEDLMKEKTENDQRIKDQEKLLIDLEAQTKVKYSKVGNLVHDSVPISNDEKDNRVEKTWGEPNRITIDGKPGSAHHHEILKWIDGYDPVRGSKIAGHRGYLLKGYGFLLNQALVSYGIKYLTEHSYTPIQPPYFMRHNIMAETCQLSDFEETLYKINDSGEQTNLDDVSYLIATSEQPISSMYRHEWIEPKELPMKYGGYSTCFRKEAGSSGKDMWGIFRVHQFEKVEQFVVTTPDKSWEAHEEMIKTAEQFYQSLELPYRVINIVSGALNDAAAKKLDLEAWFPGYNDFRELVSCSNCTDYQARSLEIRLRSSDHNKKEYVHMLNATLCATTRTLCCILENYQTEDGVKVPKVLQPYVGTDFIPYNKDIIALDLKEKEKEKKEKESKDKDKDKGKKKEKENKEEKK